MTRLRRAMRIATAMLLLAACEIPDERAISIVQADPVPTTSPVGVALQPTPTPFAVPQAAIDQAAPTATPMTTPEPYVAPDDTAETPMEPAPTAPTAHPTPSALPTPAPTDTAPPAPTGLPTAILSEEPTPVPTAIPSEEAAAPATPEPSDTTTPARGTAERGSAALAAAGTPQPARVVTPTGYKPLGLAGEISLMLPVDQVEKIGFHQASHPGAVAINAAITGVDTLTLDSRGRGTHARSAADIVVPPGEPVIAPVTGTVVAAGGYVLYCKYDDSLVYIEPADMPGWQVKLFHLEGEVPPVGAWVEAGVTRIASGARILPFESQVDEHTNEPSWPHVHIEVIDPSVPDTRPPGPGCP